MWNLSFNNVFTTFKSPSYCPGLSQAEAKTSEGCRLNGHGEEQRGCRLVSSAFFFPLFVFLFPRNQTISVVAPSLRCVCVCFSQTAMWPMNWWFLVRVAEWEWETLMLRDAWWWSTCCVRWKKRSEHPVIMNSWFICFIFVFVFLHLSSFLLWPHHLNSAGITWDFTWVVYYCYSDWTRHQSHGTQLLCEYCWNF